MKYTWPPLLLTLFFMTSCSPGSLNPTGKVLYWSNHPDSDLQEVSKALAGLQFSVAPWNQPWSILLTQPSGQPDLILTPLARDLIDAGAKGNLLPLGSLKTRMKSFERLSPPLKSLGEEKLFPYFVPASVQPWVLVTSREIQPPATLEDLEITFRELKENGTIPLALGSSFGWTALGLFAALDVSRNGSESYLNLYKGTRTFGDPSLEGVYATLAHWRDAQWVDPEAGTLTWQESLLKVSQGKAGYAFLPAGYVGRAVSPQGLRYFPFPPQSSQSLPASLAIIQGFAVNKNSSAPEAALALADRYLSAGLTGVLKEPETYPVAPPDSPADSPSPAVFYLPTLDYLLPAQVGYTATQALASFFAPKSRLTPRDLRTILETVQKQP